MFPFINIKTLNTPSLDPALVSVTGEVKYRQEVSSEEASSTPGVAKVKKIKSSEESSSKSQRK